MSDLNAVIQPFDAIDGHNQSTVAATSTAGASGSVALPPPCGSTGATSFSNALGQMLVYNSGTVVVFVAFGNSAVVATAPVGATPGGTPIPPGAMVTLTVRNNPGFAAAIAATGTVTVYFTPGAGS